MRAEEGSRVGRREALSALLVYVRPPSMARYRLLPLPSSLQLGWLRQEALGRCIPSSPISKAPLTFFSPRTGLPFYQDKLHEETVYRRFGEILTKVRPFLSRSFFPSLTFSPSQIRAPANKLSKTESDLKEFEDALEQHRAKGTEDQDLQKKVQKSRKRAGGKAAPAKKEASAPVRRTARARKARRSETPPSSPEHSE
jgi:hypothetical protein